MIPDYQEYAACNTLPDDACGTVSPPEQYPLDGSLQHPNPRARAAAQEAFYAILSVFARPALPQRIPCPRCLEPAQAARWVGRTWLGCACGWTVALTPAQEAELRCAVRGEGSASPAALVATWTLAALGLTVTNPRC